MIDAVRVIPEQVIDASKIAPAAMRGKILEFEKALLSGPSAVHLFPIEHYFAPGLYLRQMTMPKNGVITGRIHRTEHYCILAKGEVSVVTEDGTKRLSAPAVVHSLPGIKRAMFAHDESVWINVHHNPTDERDLERIEAIFTANSFEELAAPAAPVLIEERKEPCPS